IGQFTMGVSIEQWRVWIGLFGSTKSRGHGALVSVSSPKNLLAALLAAVVISSLLAIGNVEVNPGPFPCEYCSAVPETISSSLNHQQFHSKNSNFRFFCPVPECGKLSSFSFGTIRTHVSIAHKRMKHRSYPDQVDVTSHLSDDRPPLFQCEVCDFSAPIIWELVQHLYGHLESGIEIKKCPLVHECDFKYPFKKKNTFQTHLSQYHKGWNPLSRRKKSSKVNDPSSCISQNQDNFYPAQQDECQDNNVPQVEASSNNLSQEDLEDASFLDDELVTDYIAKFYLQLYGDFFLPYDMIQEICSSLTFLSEVMHARIKRTLVTELKKISLPEEAINRIRYKVMEVDLLYSTHHKNSCGSASFTSDHLRKKYFKEKMGYRPPIEISLDHNNVKSANKYQYVPINETLESVLQDPTVMKEVDESFVEQSTSDELVSNYTDGTLFKSEQHPTKEIHLMLYQDGYNPVMNVLGSAKNKFKALAMYFTIGNLKSTLRSKVSSKHLVMLVRESVMKAVGPKKCFERLIADLKKLEASGIAYKGEIVKVIVEFFIGDNLGQHFIGGFIGSFSSTYFCRYCIIKKKDFQSNPENTRPPITIQKYNQCALKAELTGHPIQGIKGNSMFNSLKYFHSTSHLAPCLAHDLFEGVVSWDLSAIISSLVKDKWFSYELLNRRIRYLSCKGTDLPKKPAYVRSKGDKLGGHAVQNWTLLRLLPFILGNKIKNTEHEAWKLYLQLKELCEILCAPKFSKSSVPYLKDVLIPAYYERRAVAIQDDKKYPLRPKHHFMSHMPELLLKYGPLIHLWSLPYEQMHKLFKTVCRLSRNFINVEYTCAVRHQMHLAYLGTGPLFPEEQIESGSKLFLLMSYSGPTLSFLRSLNLGANWYECRTLQLNGLLYKEGDFLLISSRGSSILVGFIKIILTKGSQVQFILETFLANYNSDYGVHQLPSDEGQFALMTQQSLLYPVPQPIYKLRSIPSFSLKNKLM
ncbi:Zinc finger protein 691, partial [Frankliniella fusca]